MFRDARLPFLEVYSRIHMALVHRDKLFVRARTCFYFGPYFSWLLSIALVGVAMLLPSAADASAPVQDSLALLKAAVQTEINADDNDHSRWRYRDDQQELGNISIVVQTDQGSVKRLISKSGKPLSADEAREEDQRITRLIHDPARLAKQKKDGEQDDKSARELLTMLPEAFTWSMEGENATSVKLHFEPKPDFHPPTLESRVLAAMSGSVIIDRAQHRIQTISGKLTQDVIFGFGLFGRLKQGGTFRVERRQLAPGLWQITETHVHIDGKALLFKSIGEQQDEVQSGYTQVPQSTTLEQAVAMSRP